MRRAFGWNEAYGGPPFWFHVLVAALGGLGLLAAGLAALWWFL